MGGRSGRRSAGDDVDGAGLGSAAGARPLSRRARGPARRRRAARPSAAETAPRRRYDATRRRALAAGTRERIVAAGAEILRRSPIRDWDALTIRAVAERAGVNERTVYRHFANERGLRDAVMHRLEESAGVDLAELRLEDVAAVAERIVAHVSAYPLSRRAPLDPTLHATGRRQRKVLLAAVTARTARWPAGDRLVAAAILDVLWSVAAYERLVADWPLGRAEATRGITWAIRLVAEAICRGRRPR